MYRNRTFPLLLLLCVISAISVSLLRAQSAVPGVWLSSDTARVTAGQEFTVTINVVGAVQAYGSSIKLTYDPAVLEVITADNQAVTPGSFFGEAPSFPLKNAADLQNGVIEYAVTLTQPALPVDGDGILGTIRFRALVETPVTVTPVEASLVSPEFTEVDGRLVAQRINTVQAQIMATTLGNAQPLSVSASGGNALTNPESAVNRSLVDTAPFGGMITMVAAAFFISGLGLLVLSVVMYSRMRSFNLMGKH